MHVCVAAGGGMCQDQGKSGTDVCQRFVSALGMNIISVIGFKSSTKSYHLSKVVVSDYTQITEGPAQLYKPGTNFGK